MNDAIREIDLKKPNPAVIKTLEDLLNYAKSGEIQGIACSVQWSGMNCGEYYAGINLDFARTIMGSLLLAREKILALYVRDNPDEF